MVLIYVVLASHCISFSTSSAHLPLLDPNEAAHSRNMLLFHCYEQPRPQHPIQLPPPRLQKIVVGAVVQFIQESDALHVLLDHVTSFQHSPKRRTAISSRLTAAFSSYRLTRALVPSTDMLSVRLRHKLRHSKLLVVFRQKLDFSSTPNKRTWRSLCSSPLISSRAPCAPVLCAHRTQNATEIAGKVNSASCLMLNSEPL